MTLKRAKKALGVVSRQLLGEAHAGWTWQLPPLPPVSYPSTDSSDATDATDATDTPDLESKTCADGGQWGSEGSEESEGSEGSVVGVVSSEGAALKVSCSGVAPASDCYPPPFPVNGTAPAPPLTTAPVLESPPQPCPGCQQPTTWLIRGAMYVCYKPTCQTAAPRQEAHR
jgi:hypothetical protein